MTEADLRGGDWIGPILLGSVLWDVFLIITLIGAWTP